VQEGAEFLPTGSDFGQVFSVPDGFGIAMTDAQSQPGAGVVDFFPTGRTQPATVRITSDDGYMVDIVCPTPAEGFTLLQS